MTPRSSTSGALGVSLASVGLMTGLAIAIVPSLIVTLGELGTSTAPGESKLHAFLAQHERSIEASRDRFNGRSVFFRPIQKPIELIPITTQPAATRPIAAVSVKRAKYRGPELIGLIDDEAWFKSTSADELVLRITAGAEASGVSVVRTNPPWSARVSYDGYEFDLILLLPMNEQYFSARQSGPVRVLRTIDGGSH